MRYSVKAACILVSGLAFAAIMISCFRHSAREDPDYRILPQSELPWHNAVIQGQKLDDQVKRVQQRCDAKDAVVAEVITGRLTLFQAAARFRNIIGSDHQAKYWLTAYAYPDQPYELALCYSVIDRVAMELRSRASGQDDGTVNRLKAELCDQLQRYGQVCLPD